MIKYFLHITFTAFKLISLKAIQLGKHNKKLTFSNTIIIYIGKCNYNFNFLIWKSCSQ